MLQTFADHPASRGAGAVATNSAGKVDAHKKAQHIRSNNVTAPSCPKNRLEARDGTEIGPVRAQLQAQLTPMCAYWAHVVLRWWS